MIVARIIDAVLLLAAALRLYCSNGLFLAVLGNRGDVSLSERLDAQLLAKLGIDAREGFLILLEVAAHVFASLPDTFALIAVPRTRLVDDVIHDSEIQGVPLARDALAVKDVELGIAEGCRYLVLHDLHFGPRADDDVALFDSTNAANVDAHGRVELQGFAARRCLWVAKHDANLLANLVDEDQARTRLRDCTCELAQRLRHQPRLQSHVGVAHLAIEFSFGNEGGDGVDDEDVDRARPHQRFDNLQRLLAVVRL